MATTIDGELDIGSITATNVVVTGFGPAAVARTKIVDDTNSNVANVDASRELSVSTEPLATTSTTTNGAAAMGLAAAQIRPAIVAPNQRKYIAITNTEVANPLNVLWIGAAGVTVGTGIPVFPGETFEDEESQGAWFGIMAVGAANAAWLQVTVP